MGSNSVIWASAILGIFGTLITFLILQYKKTFKMLENDRAFKKFNNDGKPIQEGIERNRWDLSYIPELSRQFFKSDWRITFSILLLIFISILYAIFRNEQFLNLILVNTGAIIGVLTKQDPKANNG